MRENTSIRLGVVTSSTLVREGIRRLLDTERGIEVVAEASNQSEVIQLVEQTRPDVLFIDTHLPNLDIIEILGSIKRSGAETKVLLLLHSPDEEVIINTISLGIRGCLKNTLDAGQFVQAIRALNRDEIWAERRLITKVLSRGLYTRKCRSVLKPKLTKREEEVVKLVSQGYANKQIAKSLYLSEKTVKAHLGRVYNKLGISNRLQILLSFSGEGAAQTSLKISPSPSPKNADGNLLRLKSD